MDNKVYTVIGLMSGTSLDGVDMACCRFHQSGAWHYEIVATRHVPYTSNWIQKLNDAFYLEPDQLDELDMAYGNYLGELVLEFINTSGLRPDLISSHGHTIFHRPEQGYTLQLGDGQIMSKITALPLVNNFRQSDVAKGGQGAPLVPVGDSLLFGDYGICLNIGGIANISYDQYGKRLAFDVCPANQVLNHLAGKAGLKYDENGTLASAGNVLPDLLHELNELDYYKKERPKSLGREWVGRVMLPILDQSQASLEDQLNTLCVHIAMQIGRATNDMEKSTMLVTGGGTHNNFLIHSISQQIKHDITIPSVRLIDFKEAIVFAFLGLLRKLGHVNCLASVTGAYEDSCTGDLFMP